jgi:7-cyano-7-deazaguanine synthase in queuosine biosynthesis
MKIEHSQDTIEIDIPDNVVNVGIRISGGTDSAILAYLLAKYKSEENPNIKLVPITLYRASKPFNLIFAEKIIKFIGRELSVNFEHHFIIGNIPDSVSMTENSQLITTMMYKEKVIDEHFVGITSTPFTSVEGLTDDLDHITGFNRDPALYKNKKEGKSNRPLYNIDKKGVAELYNKFNLNDTLFPLTRSCEECYPNGFENHCGECWWCKERYWAFGRYS